VPARGARRPQPRHGDPYQKPGTPEEHGLTAAQYGTAIWASTPERNRCSGAAAINAALAVVLNTRPPLWLYATPGIE
jgi:hypothetical protein